MVFAGVGGCGGKVVSAVVGGGTVVAGVVVFVSAFVAVGAVEGLVLVVVVSGGHFGVWIL